MRTVYGTDHSRKGTLYVDTTLTPQNPAPGPKAVPPADTPADERHSVATATPRWQKYGTSILILLLALIVLFTVTHNWNSWEGGHAVQVTDDAYVRGDLTPLSTKVPGIVRKVDVSDYQQVHKGDLLVELEDNDYQAQVAQASAAVEAARAAIENNRRQFDLQDADIQKALAGIDQAQAQIAAAKAGKDAVEAGLVRARSERQRQEGLYQTHSTTQQNLEQAVAAEESLAGQYASSDAALTEARTGLRSSELTAEAERRKKSVLESQRLQLAADLRAKEAGLVAARWTLVTRKSLHRTMAAWVNGKSGQGNWCPPAQRSFPSSIARAGCRRIIRRRSSRMSG